MFWKRRLCAPSILAIWAWASPAASAIDGTPTWSFSLVAPDPGPDFFITSPRIAFDHYGTPAVMWSRVDRNGVLANTVYHSELTPLGIWSQRQLASGAGFGLQTALAYDRSERPHLAWINADGTLRASYNFQAPQTLSASPVAATAPASLALGFDLAGTLRGMYAGQNAGDFGSLSWSGSSYSNGLLTTVPNMGLVDGAALTVDHRGLRQMIVDARLQPSGNPAVFLVSEPSNSSSWVSAVLLTADDVAGVDIKTEPGSGRIGFAYAIRSGAASQLYFAESNGTSLTTTLIVDTSAYQIGDLTLAYDASDGQPAIAFEDATDSDLLFASRGSSGSWTLNVVDNTISISAPDGRPRGPSLAFNDYGTGWPAIAYVDADGSLRVAFDPPGGAPEPASLLLLGLGLLVPRRSSRNRGEARRTWLPGR